MSATPPETPVPPLVLAIGGSDPSGGAGVQADLLTVRALGGHALTAVTSVTAQNTRGVSSVHHLTAAVVRAQLAAVFEDFAVGAIKTGMLGTDEIVAAVAGELSPRAGIPLVVDPVLVSTGGVPLLSEGGLAAVRERLLPLASVCTPNRREAALLSGLTVSTLAEAESAARRILALGARAVVVKGGHAEGDRAEDLLVDPQGARVFSGPRIPSADAHGTGCVFASALATGLARGATLDDAVREAKRFVTRAIAGRLRIGGGGPIVNPTGDGEERGRDAF
jgi:hydroxymethylpyrimidine/phosphomethylpyrimidine kinase